MQDQKVFQILISPHIIHLINKDCSELGYSNIRLFHSDEYKTKNTICFIAEQEDVDSIFVAIEAKRKIEENLQCEVTFITERQLDNNYRNSIIKGSIPYIASNIENINHFITKNYTLAKNKKYGNESEVGNHKANKKSNINYSPNFWPITQPNIQSGINGNTHTITPILIANNTLTVLKRDPGV